MPQTSMRHWPAIVTAVAATAFVVPVARHLASAGDTPALVAKTPEKPATNPNAVTPSAISGIQIERMQLADNKVSAPAIQGRTAYLTVSPSLQAQTLDLYKRHKIPDGGTVLLDVKTGRVLVYASAVSKGPIRDRCADASAPAASIFKIITASALVEKANLGPQTRQCYHGGQDRIVSQDLVDDSSRDKWCATLAEAMGRSLNTIFARLALRHLDVPSLQVMGGAYGFGLPPSFDLPVQPSTLSPPADDLGFARTAAGFWNSTLSPLHAASIAATIASRGTMIRPSIVASVTDSTGATIYKAPEEPQVLRKPIKPETADALREMLEATTTVGTGFRAFHDKDGKSFLPGIKVAGKTGTLTRAKTQEYVTWFVGFAPSDAPQVAIASVAINKPKWQTRANVMARDVLRAYFTMTNAPGVTMP